MRYALVANDVMVEYPYTTSKLRLAHKNVGFPKNIPEETLALYGVMPVSVADEPAHDAETQVTSLDPTPSLADGSWTRGWTVRSLTSAELAAKVADKSAGVRSSRDELLAATDWEAIRALEALYLADTPLGIYRKALRDLPASADFPDTPMPTR